MATSNNGGTNRLYWILGAVALAALVIVGMRVGGSVGTVSAPVEIDGLDDPARLVELAQGMVLGDAEAPVTIYEFGDYQCPGCGAFASQVKPLVESAFITDGRAKFVFYDFPLVSIHPNAFLAHRASRCAADQGLYWDYHKKLFDEQRGWSASSSPAGLFVNYADDLDADTDAFESCLKSDAHAEVVTAQMRLGEALGITGTPSVMVSRGEGQATRLADVSFPSIQAAVEGLLQESAATATETEGDAN